MHSPQSDNVGLELVKIEPPDTDYTRWAKQQLADLEREYRARAEPFIRILTDHAISSPPRYIVMPKNAE